jgi:hypothetical protein
MDDKHTHVEHDPKHAADAEPDSGTTYEGGTGAPSSGTGAVGGGTNAPSEPPGSGAPHSGTGAVGGGTNDPGGAGHDGDGHG